MVGATEQNRGPSAIARPPTLFFALAIAVLFAAPYLAGAQLAWRYLAADVAIALLAAAYFGPQTLRRLGLAIPSSELLAGALAFAVVAALAFPFADHIARLRGFEIVQPRPWFSVSQVLHQELVLRALLLGALYGVLRSAWRTSALAAVAFVAAHVALYWAVNGVLLSPVAIATLLAFALAGNLLFLHFGHIAFSFAIHAGWNIARFGTHYRLLGEPSNEAHSFGVFEGSPATLAAALALLALAVFVTRMQAARSRARS